MRRLILVVLAALVAGCAVRRELARDALLMRAASWQSQLHRHGDVALRFWHPAGLRSDRLTVYLEGDGAAWRTPLHPPVDPTPDEPLALALALADGRPAVAYLARPCQYLAAPALARCGQAWWTHERFSPLVLKTMNEVLDTLKATTGARELELVGYSGGGVLATLLAGRRDDVAQLITVAAPLSLAAWTQAHGLAGFPASADPVQQTDPLPPAIHYAGSEDRIVPAEIVRDFVARRGGRLEIMAGHDHRCCWHRIWLTRSKP